MSRILFIADLHLCQEEPAITAGFLHFLANQALTCSELYILGDLFEAWIGDDDPSPLPQQIAQALAALPIPVYFIHGNRDFLVGKRFAQQAGMQRLPEEVVLERFGQRLVIMHGDTLCTDDVGYLAFRKKVHTPWIQWLFLHLPLALRLNIARKMRQSSQQANQHKTMAVMDVNPQAVIEVLQRHQATLLVHGHTHQPAIHPVPEISPLAQRAVLGAWHHEGWMIEWTEQGLTLSHFPW
ncbi:UDP-2,3-diacylglucosamine diphosphatase [Rosenbergiella epipactidis]|uniref:UDP-2,3-diacylglucosamine diphosphatase n=1 Tax=Rosenbergiella epipactidis TaxID=1544694 RepID=UPI00066472C3|nr:UDP-2,3-diacylglucosamine diphosphatase [Rosenbergiella epipactidis]KMV73788.1 UDP-2,3-diacylglucosamine hydrolase [bacteria symbiont BFo2 of Frankliniella occidentalis]KYP93193.1 UDP-2,3-diacylglucosamine hydrolase [bacteria symbiont BFo2 of Frankliniella occidentalis]KYP93787.1 UDP-2,3-diacylglucosamine hydrolase [bacteria symbiont BFo2 of Frankliniella occidentalis]